MKLMNGSERMRAAMRKQIPDRVPVMCQLSLGHYFKQTGLPPADIWHDTPTFVKALVMLQQCYGFDGILVNLPGRNPNWREALESRTEQDSSTVLRWENGLTTICPHDDNPHVVRPDGTSIQPSFEELNPEALYYVDPHDQYGITTALSSPEPDFFFPVWHEDGIRLARKMTQGKVSVHGEVFSPFSQFMELLDHSIGLMALMEDPDKCHAIFARLSEGTIALGRRQRKAGADAVLISSAFTGAGFISRETYSEFEQPYLQRIVQGIKKDDDAAIVYLHTCGAIGDRLDLMEQTGIDGLDTLDPPPLGTVDLEAAIARLGKRVFIKGNLDPVHTLLNGSTAQVRDACRERLRIASPGGAYILSTACSVAPHTPPENIKELRAAVDDFSDQ